MAKQQPKRRKKKIISQSGGSAAISLNCAAEIDEAEKIKGPVLTIKFKYLAIAAYLYMVVPILIFFVSWLRWYVGFPMAAILILGLYILLKTDYLNNNDMILLPWKHFIMIAFTFLLWVWLSGQGGFFYQTSDNHWRNAVFRDLINFSWPVIYPKTGNALVYYLMHWIVPALFGKLFGWVAGNIALALWTYAGILISYLLIAKICNADATYKFWLIALIFIGWGGLNQIGLSLMEVLGYNHYCLNSGDGWLDLAPLVNGYGYGYQYSTNDTLLCWVYNQTIVPWIAVPLFLDNKKISSMAFLGLCVLPFAPLPFVGLFLIMVCIAIPEAMKAIKAREFTIFKKIFSIPNLSAVCTIFIVFWLFFKLDGGVSGSAVKSVFGLYVPLKGFNFTRIALLLLFDILDFGVFAVLIFNRHKKNLLFYIVVISLILIPNFRIGEGSRDFCMRASIPALFVLMIMVMQYLCQRKEIVFKNMRNTVALIVALTLCGFNVYSSYCGKLEEIRSQHTFPISADTIKTFSDKQIGDTMPGFGNLVLVNFLCPDPGTKAFYKYLARN